MTRSCQNCRQNFEITEDDMRFYDKIMVPPPTFCPSCRDQRRWSFRNERNLYHRRCDLCYADIISMYTPEKQHTIYCPKCWYSDKWDSLQYGRDYNFSRPFLEQFNALMLAVPRLALVQENTINSPWVNYERGAKNCYLCVGGEDNENCFYTTYGIKSKEVIDSFWAIQCQLCYELINCSNCYQTFFSHWCFNCYDTWFSYDCRNCNSVFGSVGLRNKQYYVFNEPYSKEEYEKKILEFFPLSLVKKEEILNKVKYLKNRLPQRDLISKSLNSQGNYLSECKNCKNCWNVETAEDSAFNHITGYVKDCYDISSVGWPELCYECYSGVHTYLCKFSSTTLVGSSVEYCDSSGNVQDSFGCVGLRNKKYCILNKQYSKEDYFELIPKIRKHMDEMPYKDRKGRNYKYGEFFPIEFSTFSYNESASQQYYSLTKEQAIEQGYSWKDPEPRNYQIQIPNDQLPDHIKDVKDDIVGQVIECAHQGKCNEQCTEAYKIIPQELQFLRKMNLPLPRLCPNCRHYQRIKQRNPLKLWHRKCQCAGETSENKIYKNTADHIYHKKDEHCPNEFETTYSPERKEIVYCEKCYLAEVV